MDFLSIYNQIESATKNSVPLNQAMHQVIDECARQRPHEDWRRLAKLDFDNDFSALRRWLADLLDKDPPPPLATGLWFGLFNFVDDDGRTSADIYLTAGVHDPDHIDWTGSPIWEPEDRYASSRTLANLCRIAYRDDDWALQNDGEYPIALAYACFAARDLANEQAPRLGTPERALFVGFDSGDLLCIGAVTPTGVRFSNDSQSLQLPETIAQ